MHQKKKTKTNKQLLINNIIYELELSERKSDRHKKKGGQTRQRRMESPYGGLYEKTAIYEFCPLGKG